MHHSSSNQAFNDWTVSWRVEPEGPLSEVVTAGRNMLCTQGTALLHNFEQAVEERAAARDRFLLASEPLESCEDLLFAAKLNYSKAFVLWVTHRGGCTECRITSTKHDLTEFASV